MMKFRLKSGFTLAEMLSVLAIMGVIAAIAIPSLFNAKPNKNKMLFKKAYYDTERVVADLINDENYYPEPFLAPGVDPNTVATTPDFSDDQEVTIAGTTYEGQTKFCKIFAEKLNTTADDACDSTSIASRTPSFSTTNGIDWYMPIQTPTFFGVGGNDGWMTITIDADPDRTHNNRRGGACRCVAQSVSNEGEQAVLDKCQACKDPNQFQIKVRSDGKMRVEGAFEALYLRDLRAN